MDERARARAGRRVALTLQGVAREHRHVELEYGRSVHLGVVFWAVCASVVLAGAPETDEVQTEQTQTAFIKHVAVSCRGSGSWSPLAYLPEELPKELPKGLRSALALMLEQGAEKTEGADWRGHAALTTSM